jgi:hypothetical protein
LAQHGVHKSGLAVVNMGDDGDIAYRLGHREFSFYWFGRWAMGLGDGNKAMCRTLRQLLFYQQEGKQVFGRMEPRGAE